MKIREIIEPSVQEINADVEGRKVRRKSKIERSIEKLDAEEAIGMGLPVRSDEDAKSVT